MACKVEIKDIQSRIKNELMDNFESIKFKGYTGTLNSKDSSIGNLKNFISQTNSLYQSNEYGEVIQYAQDSNIFTLKIDPSIELAEAMTLQNENIEVYSKKEFVNSNNSEIPVTDNVIEYKRYKLNFLSEVENHLKKLNRDKRNPKNNVEQISKQINKYNKIKAKIKNDIDLIDSNQVDLLFQALSSEIEEIFDIIDSINYDEDRFNLDTVKNRIDFLFEFMKGITTKGINSEMPGLRNFIHPDYLKLVDRVDQVLSHYNNKLSDLRDILVQSDISYQNNVLNNDRVTEEQIKNMFNATSDINWLEKTFLGITESSRNDTILPQILKSYLETHDAIRHAETKDYQEKLSYFAKIFQGKNTEFLFEKTSKGNKTGNIINLFSPEYSNKLSKFFKIRSNEDFSREEKYKRQVTWLKQNTEVIDFRKLKSIKDIYSPMYSEQFTFSDEEMTKYEDQLKDLLGPLFEQEIDKILNSLENFEVQKNSILEDESNRFRFENITRINPWDFIKNYYSPNYLDAINYNSGGINTERTYSDISNIRFIPKKEVFLKFDPINRETIYKDSGFYNQDFKEILNDPTKLDLWKLLVEIYSDQIGSLYDESTIHNMSYAKFEKEFLEQIASSKGMLQKGSQTFLKAAHTFKSFFYEVGTDNDRKGIAKNYYDSSKKEMYDLKKILDFKSIEDLNLIANKAGIDITNLSKEELIKEIAYKQVIPNYSTDIFKSTAALLDLSATMKSKQDTLPIANMILDSHKLIKNEKGEDRKRSVERLENWINRIVKGQNEKYRGSTNWIGKDITKDTWLGSMLDRMGQIPFISKFLNKKKLSLLSDSEKELLKYLEDLKRNGVGDISDKTFKVGDKVYLSRILNDQISYFTQQGEELTETSEIEFEKGLQKFIEQKIESLGLDLSTGGIIQGILKSIILKGLGLNPISGIFNRVEGKNSGLIMDKTGKYWTKGNIHYANNFMIMSNFLKFLPDKFTPEQNKRIQEMKKFSILINSLGLIQNRKNELERQQEKSKFNYSELFNIYQFAVENPEMKNQGSILLAILMDTKIKDIDGNEYQIFNGQGLEVFDIGEKGNLVLKPQFRTESNLKNWERFEIDSTNLLDNQFLLTKNKIINAISRSQGNYDPRDTIEATRTIWGRSLTLFQKWRFEHFMQRFSSGKAFDLTTGENKLKGRYISLYQNNPALFTTGLITMFTGFGITPVVGMLGLGFTGFVAIKYIKDTFGKKALDSEISNTLQFIDFIKSILIESLNYPLELINSSKIIPNNTYKKSNLSKEDIGNLQAVSKELAIKLTYVAMLLLMKKLYDDDEDKNSKSYQFHNFVDNQLMRMIDSLSTWNNPETFISDIQRMAFLEYLFSIQKTLSSIITLDEDDKLSKNLMKVVPIPRMLYKNSLPWYDEIQYDKGNHWTDKIYKSDREKYNEIRDIKKAEIERELQKENIKPSQYKKELNKRMRKELPTKANDLSYRDILDAIESGETGESFSKKRKATSKQRKAEFEELLDSGLSESEANKILKEQNKRR